METLTISVKGYKFWPMLMIIDQWGFYIMPHLQRHGASVYNGHLSGPMTLTLTCRVFSNGVVITRPTGSCFKDLDLSRPGIKPQSPAFEASALLPPLQPKGHYYIETQTLHIITLIKGSEVNFFTLVPNTLTSLAQTDSVNPIIDNEAVAPPVNCMLTTC